MYLHITGQTYGRPIAGQKEVSAVSYTAKGNLWKAMVRNSAEGCGKLGLWEKLG